MQLRYQQALEEVAAEHNSTTIFPLPVDLVAPFTQHLARQAQGGGGPQDPAG